MMGTDTGKLLLLEFIGQSTPAPDMDILVEMLVRKLHNQIGHLKEFGLKEHFLPPAPQGRDET